MRSLLMMATAPLLPDSPSRSGIDDQRLSDLLDIWAEWMRGKEGPAGYSSRAHIGSSTASKEWDAMLADMEVWQAKAVNAAIDDLPINEAAAVYHVKLASVYRLREPIELVYDRARELLKIGLRARHVH